MASLSWQLTQGVVGLRAALQVSRANPAHSFRIWSHCIALRASRHLLPAHAYRQRMSQRFQTWRETTGLAT